MRHPADEHRGLWHVPRDLKRGWWELPREKTKGDRVHGVPLTALALEQLEEQPQGDSWVFPSFKGRPLKVLALSHALRHNRQHFGLDRFTPHDLRRTAASHLASVGVERFSHQQDSEPREA